jgi:hypothetical protein
MMDKSQLMHLFVWLFVLPFVVLPALGGGAVTVGYHLAKLPAVRFFQSWKIYLASCCYGFLFLVPVGLILRESEMSAFATQGIQLAVFCGTQLILVPIFLRSFTRKALGVTALAVVVTNGIAYLLFVLQRA